MIKTTITWNTCYHKIIELKLCAQVKLLQKFQLIKPQPLIHNRLSANSNMFIIISCYFLLHLMLIYQGEVVNAL